MQTSSKTKVLGVSGCATAGKDTFTDILVERLRLKNKTVKRIALAEPLKGFCDPFCKENLGISSFTQVPPEKILIRPFLVWFGDAKRKQTGGRFWIDKANEAVEKAESQNIDYAIITDVRYAHYERDEVYWLKNERQGTLVHISRYDISTPTTTKVSNPSMEKIFIPPANDHEMINDPKVKKSADFIVEWPTLKIPRAELLKSPEMIKYVDEFIAAKLDI